MKKTLNIHSKTIAYQGFFKIELVDYQHSLYQGGMSPKIRRELFNRGQAVVVLLYDLTKQCVVLIEQCRAGALEQAIISQHDHQAWLIEPVAGMIDEGETAQQACEREVLEEAGIALKDFEYISQFYPSPGGSSEILHLYAAQLDSDQLAEFSGLEHEVEDIRIIKLAFSQAKQRLLNGEFNVASTIIGLQWLFFQRLIS
ncbi:MAG: NUDIX domain-containing protein [Thiomicrospira sp.]|uniref:NUDIX domain-containing protein n=1 Tax=Thiomicrospira sp. TaxID=935 RepID=UPI0019EC77DA|nr:NUDIX domain-containing protein [Thiomicrospira sp.]MBE0493358.1 NUDIX domain-containing protein [Thiomicrospira sp.]